MARIAWGTPTLIEGKLGVVLEIGQQARLLILGSITSMLPVKDAAIVVLNLDFIGSIDFATGAIAFDATLINSRILAWPISGEAALRTGWGPSAGLVASVGGLHPQFPVPANFPTLQAITIAFGSNNPSVTLTAHGRDAELGPGRRVREPLCRGPRSGSWVAAQPKAGLASTRWSTSIRSSSTPSSRSGSASRSTATRRRPRRSAAARPESV